MIIVTNRKLCQNEDLVAQIRKIAPARPKRILLREKDIPSGELIKLGRQIQEICYEYKIAFGMNSDVEAARELKAECVHLPFSQFTQLSEKEKKSFSLIGTSVHRAEEALKSEEMGAAYVIAGHIFETNCKSGLEPRGLSFLQKICQTVKIPVYAIGGLNPENVSSVMECGADGICIMSGAMICSEPDKYIKKFPKDA